MAELKMINLGVRFLLELCALAALGFWGFHTGSSTWMRILLGIGAPLLAAVVWGLFVAPKAAISIHPGLRLAVEVLVFGSAVLGLAAAGRSNLAWVFAVLVIVSDILKFVWRQ